MRLAALIVTHNRLKTLKKGLKATLAEDLDHILVIDNASSDGTADWLAGLSDPRLDIRRLDVNVGGAGGFAAGLTALSEGPAPLPDWIAIYDDDAWPDPGAMAAFRARHAGIDPDAPGPDTPGVIAAAVRHPGGTLSEMNRPGLNPFWHLPVFLRALTGGRRGFHLADADFAAEAPMRRVDTASFVGFFLSRGALARAGLPEAGLFIYGDDLLYALRIRRHGIAIELDPAIRFTHDCGTIGPGFHYRPLWKIYYHARNGVAIARAAAGPVVFPAALAYYVALWWRRSRFCPAATRGLYRQLMWRGLRDGLAGRRGPNPEVHRLAALAEAPAAR